MKRFSRKNGEFFKARETNRVSSENVRICEEEKDKWCDSPGGGRGKGEFFLSRNDGMHKPPAVLDHDGPGLKKSPHFSRPIAADLRLVVGFWCLAVLFEDVEGFNLHQGNFCV